MVEFLELLLIIKENVENSHILKYWTFITFIFGNTKK